MIWFLYLVFAGTPLLEAGGQLQVELAGARYSTGDTQHHILLSCGPIGALWVDTLKIVWIVSRHKFNF